MVSLAISAIWLAVRTWFGFNSGFGSACVLVLLVFWFGWLLSLLRLERLARLVRLVELVSRLNFVVIQFSSVQFSLLCFALLVAARQVHSKAEMTDDREPRVPKPH